MKKEVTPPDRFLICYVRQNLNRKFITEIWLWAVAVAFTVAAICTFAAWVVGLTICVMRLING